MKGSSNIDFQTPSDNYIRGHVSIDSLKSLPTYAALGNNFRRIGAIEVDRGGSRIGLVIAGAAHNAQNELQVFIRNLGMAPDSTAANGYTIGTHLYAVLLGESIPAASSDRAHYLTEQDEVPGTDGFSVGDITNVGGHLYELVDDAAEANILTGVSAAQSGSYVGSAAFEWLPSGNGNLVRAMLPKTALGQSPPGSLAYRFEGTEPSARSPFYQNQESGPTSGGLRRAASRDTTTPTHTSRRRPASAYPSRQLPVPRVLLAAAGVGGAAFVRPVVVHSADRWETLQPHPGCRRGAGSGRRGCPRSRGGAALGAGYDDGDPGQQVDERAVGRRRSAVRTAGTGSTVTITIGSPGVWSVWTDFLSVPAGTIAGVAALKAVIQGAVDVGQGGGDRVYWGRPDRADAGVGGRGRGWRARLHPQHRQRSAGRNERRLAARHPDA